jgi:uncharacterized membrane protein
MSTVLDRARAVLDAPDTAVEPVGSPPASRPSPHKRPFSRLRVAAAVALGLQLVVLLVVSTMQYRRFALGQDFAGYTQAWWKIAHLHLDPWSTIFSTSFWRNDGELLMWPLALLFHVFPNPVQLLWVQDAAAVATEMVAFAWILDVLADSDGRATEHHRLWLGAGALAAIVVNPWFYEAVAFDFHFEIVAGLFAVLAGRDLWAGQTRRLWWWVALALASHDLAGALCVLGIGVSGVLAGRRTRRTGWIMASAGLGWLMVTSAIGAAGLGGRLEREGFGYLTGSRSGPLAVVIGIPHHLPAVLHLLSTRWPAVLALLASAALVGVLSPWAAGIVVVALAPCVLNANPAFLFLSFQNWPILPFVLVGSVMVLLRVLGSTHRWSRHLRTAVVTGCVCAVVITAGLALPTVARSWLDVPPATAAALDRAEARIPPGAEVVASAGVVGRFAQREQVYPFPFQFHPVTTPGPLTYPVEEPKVAFVFVTKGRGNAVFVLVHGGRTNVPSVYTAAAIAYVTNTLHARTVASGRGVRVLLWTPPPGTSHVTLPSPS